MKTVPLSEVAEIVSGATPKTSNEDYWGGEIFWVTPADLSKLDGAYISSTPRTITEAGLQSCAATVLPAGSVLLSSRAPIGHVAINTEPMATNQGFKSLIPRTDCADAKYLYHWLRASTEYLQSLGNGATFKEISKAVVSKVEIPLPPIDEQRRIAAILDHADGLRVKRRRAIAQLGDLAESIFLDLFSEDAADAVSFDSVVTNFRNGLSPAKAGTVMADVLTLSAVTQGIFDPTAVKTSTFMAAPPAAMRVSGDDFLICRGNGNLNLVGVGVSPGHDHPDLTFPDTVIAASFDAAVVDPVYLEMAWKRPSVRRQIESVARTTNGTYKINQQSLGAVRIVIPPLSEQQEFARRIGAIPNPDLGEMDELFQSLQSRAFSGQL